MPDHLPDLWNKETLNDTKWILGNQVGHLNLESFRTFSNSVTAQVLFLGLLYNKAALVVLLL